MARCGIEYVWYRALWINWASVCEPICTLFLNLFLKTNAVWELLQWESIYFASKMIRYILENAYHCYCTAQQCKLAIQFCYFSGRSYINQLDFFPSASMNDKLLINFRISVPTDPTPPPRLISANLKFMGILVLPARRSKLIMYYQEQ